MGYFAAQKASQRTTITTLISNATALILDIQPRGDTFCSSQVVE